MNSNILACTEVRELISPLLDEALPAGSIAAVHVHCAACADCAALLEGQQRLHVDLQSLLRQPSEPSLMSQRVLQQLGSVAAPRISLSPVQSQTTHSTRKLLAAVACCLLAMVLIMLVVPTVIPLNRRVTSGVPFVPSVAWIRSSTGPVDLWDQSTGTWQPADLRKPHSITHETSLRTREGTLLELQTECGVTLRLRDKTEVAFRSTSEVELREGELWCAAPEGCSLTVFSCPTSKPVVEPVPTAQPPTAWSPALMSCVCPSSSTAVNSLTPAGAARVTCASGEIEVADERVEVASNTTFRKISPGSSLYLDASSPFELTSEDLLAATAWTMPLLLQKSPDDAELQGRLDELLSLIGYTKVSVLYEDQIRQLGSPGVPPLIAFLNSPRAADPQKRSVAARMVAELANVDQLPLLKGLAQHEDPTVRQYIASAIDQLEQEQVEPLRE